MSVCIASFIDGGKQLIMAADSRGCVEHNGAYFQTNDETTKLYTREDGLVFYCSGVISIAQDVAKILLELEDFGHEEVLQVLKFVYADHLKRDPSIANIKHALQFVIPFEVKESGLWQIAYYDCQNHFKRETYGASTGDISVFGIGTGAKIIHPILDKGLRQTEETNVIELFHRAFSQAADERCGGILNLVFFTEKRIWKNRIKINDAREIRKWPQKESLQLAAGDGVIVSPSGDNISGRMFERKLEGSFELVYHNSNYAKERRLILRDEGVELSTETGDIVIGHDVGSYIKLKANGDIEVNAVGKIYFNGNEYDFS